MSSFTPVDTTYSLLLCGALSLLILVFLWKSHNPASRNLPPCLPALPLVGSIPFLRLRGTDDHLRYQELAEKYGNIYSFWLGRKFVVLISGYDLIRTALLDQPIVMAGRPHSEMHSSFQGVELKCLGLIKPSYAIPGWKKDRQISLAILRGLGFGKSLIESKIARELENLISYLGNSNEKPENIRQALLISVSNVICSIVLGRRFPLDDCSELKSVLDAMEKRFTLTTRTVVADFVPMMAHLPSLKKNVSGLNHWRGVVRSFLDSIIEDHEKAYTATIGEEDDFIDAFIRRTGKEYNSERLMNIVDDLFGAGTETSATTLQWAVVYMANNQDIQRKVQLEIDNAVGHERLVRLEDKPLLPYTEAVVLEVQRLSTLVPLAVPHMTLGDTELSGYHIPAKSMVLINLWSVLRDPALWPEPDKFRPERFLSDRGGIVHRSELIPFSLGRRSCLGEALARQELFLFFCGLVQKFNIRPPDGIAKIDEKGTTGITRTPLPFKVNLD